MTKVYRTRVELLCGMNESIPRRKEMYRRAQNVADQFDMETYFDEHEEHGDRFVDGYVYPCSDNLLEVLRTLDKSRVEYDNIDIPKPLEDSPLHRTLLRLHPPGRGVAVNPGDIERQPCRRRRR